MSAPSSVLGLGLVVGYPVKVLGFSNGVPVLAGNLGPSPIYTIEQTANLQPIPQSAGVIALYVVNPTLSVTSEQGVGTPGIYECDSTGGAFAISLPPTNGESAGSGMPFYFKMVAGTADITITAAGSDTIDGAATVVLSEQWAFVVICSDAVGKWLIFGISATGAAKV